uniref:Uncharacterized protein n=1 Tax=Knipowitschia caucasica TaxID=637954 RepID=A0AAV2M0K0_KNICA
MSTDESFRWTLTSTSESTGNPGKDMELDMMRDMINKSKDQKIKLKLGQVQAEEDANQFLNESLNKL